MPRRKKITVGRVKVYPPRNGSSWTVQWKELGQWVTRHRKAEVDAMALAEETESRLQGSQSPAELPKGFSRDSWEILRLANEIPREEAISALQAVVDRQKRGGAPDGRLTVGEAIRHCASYLDERVASKTMQPESARQCRQLWAVWAQHFGEKTVVESIGHEQYLEWVRGMKAPGTRQQHVSKVKWLLDRCRYSQLLPAAFKPLEFLNSRHHPELFKRSSLNEKLVEVYSAKELNECLSVATLKPDQRAFVALAAFAGLRPSEIVGKKPLGDNPGREGLFVSEINLAERWIYVERSKVPPRRVSFSPKPEAGLGEELAAVMWKRLTDYLLVDGVLPEFACVDPVFQKAGYRTISRPGVDRRLSRAWEKQGGAWIKDGFRHTFISSLLALGISRSWVAEMSGNSEAIIRTNYAHPMSESDARKWWGMDAHG